jgi:transcription elongation factor GreA
MANGKNKTIPITEEGLKALQAELEYLRTTGRAEMAARIGDAKSDGDISENAGYDEAKHQQAFLEGRILELEQKIKNAVVIRNHDAPAGYVALGRSITIRERGSDDVETYLLVGSAEANPTQGRISNESPMGRSLIDKQVGDRIEVETPGGMLEFEIVAIE